MLEKDPTTGKEVVLETGKERSERTFKEVVRISAITQSNGGVLLMPPIDPQEALELLQNSYFAYLKNEVKYDSLYTTQELEECIAYTLAMVMHADRIQSILSYGRKPSTD